MDKLHILVVENRANWLEELPRILQRLSGDPQIDTAQTLQEAVAFVARASYDLAVVDLALRDNPNDIEARDELGWELLQKLRDNRQNYDCGVIVLTGYPSSGRTKRALRDYAAHDFIEKDSFSSAAFLEAARGAIAAARIRRAARRNEERYRLTIAFGRGYLTGASLIGPDRRLDYVSEEQHQLAAADLARRADNLNLLILKGGPDLWRPEARTIGDAIGDALASDRRIFGDLVAAQALVARFSDLWIEFSGPPEGLGIPFELLRDKGEYLALNHMMTRRVDSSDFPMSRKPGPFSKHVQQFVDRRQPLHALIVAVNNDGSTPAVEREATSIARILSMSLEQLGLSAKVDLLIGEQATLEAVDNRLRSGAYHLFHYAGHGWFDDQLPETSGLVFRSGNQPRVLTAAALNLLMADSELRLVYVSACVSARTAEQVGRGDFFGVMEAIARADVPNVVGYRWTVEDRAALQIAESFYRTLWRTLSPAEALLEARRLAAAGPEGRDNDSWASPILLMQNG